VTHPDNDGTLTDFEGRPLAGDRAASLRRLMTVFDGLESVCVAFSGGVDSSLVLFAAARALKSDHVVAFTAVSETYLPSELETARGFAAGLGVRHVIATTRELEDERFAANSPERCYYCKTTLVAEMASAARGQGCGALADGANRDDLGDHRPGMRAADERGVLHPLIRAGFGKDDVRSTAREAALPTWDAPQQACLASRIPYGERITAERLERIAAAEAALHELGFRQCRVRDHGDIARVEVEAEDLARAAGEARALIVERLHALGFTYVTLDLMGFRSGSLNEPSQRPSRERRSP
jgi:uncharacterized protein